jgi:hypothetical protein
MRRHGHRVTTSVSHLLTDWHNDTYVVGPGWAVVQKALVVAKGEPVYIVTDYRALPGHRPQLRQVLDRNAQDTPGRSVLFAHVEGASWNFLDITRYDAWAEMGAPPPQPAGGAQQDQGLAIRDHMAVHHGSAISSLVDNRSAGADAGIGRA